MHGRLKVKDSAEKAAEKARERDKKRRKYIAGITDLFDRRRNDEHSAKSLQVGGLLLQANPDVHTIWNTRRESLLKMRLKYVDDLRKTSSQDIEPNCEEKNDLKGTKCFVVTEDAPIPSPNPLPKTWQELFSQELDLVSSCLEKNPKSYGAWHHRIWVIRQLIEGAEEEKAKEIYEKEMKLCNLFLQLDERNFHCWDYRRFIVKESNADPKSELSCSLSLINRNFSNFSAWHYRSKLLPQLYPSQGPHPIAESQFEKELMRSVEAVFTDPSDQSPWFFLRWLLLRPSKKPQLLMCGVKKTNSGDIVLSCSFTSAVDINLVPTVSISPSSEDYFPLEKLVWTNPCDHSSSKLWTTLISKNQDCNQIKIETFDEKCFVLNLAESSSKVISADNFEVKLPSISKEKFEELIHYCDELNSIEPDGKWVLLTLVELLCAINSESAKTRALEVLDKLQTIDPLRSGYYQDYKNKMVTKDIIIKHFSAVTSTTLNLSGLQLTKLQHIEYLSAVTDIDLSCNQLKSIKSLSYFVICSAMILDDNPLTDLSPLSQLQCLQSLSLNNCSLEAVDILLPLLGVKSLKKLSLRDNKFDQETKDDIKQRFSQLKIEF